MEFSFVWNVSLVLRFYIYIYNHNWDFLHSFEFFFSPHFLCYCNNSSWLHFCLCSCSQPVFFPLHLYQLFNKFFILSNATRLRLEKKICTHCVKNYGMSNVNQARAFGMQYVIMAIVVEALLLHYNLLSRNYKLFVVSDMSQFQHSSILKTTKSFALNLDATKWNEVIFFLFIWMLLWYDYCPIHKIPNNFDSWNQSLSNGWPTNCFCCKR